MNVQEINEKEIKFQSIEKFKKFQAVLVFLEIDLDIDLEIFIDYVFILAIVK